MVLYHGSKEIVEYPEIRKARFQKDFYLDFTAHFMQSRRSVGQPDTVMGTSINMNMYQAVL